MDLSTGTAVTTRLAAPVKPAATAVIWVMPPAAPKNTPDPSTVATAVVPLDQVRPAQVPGGAVVVQAGAATVRCRPPR